MNTCTVAAVLLMMGSSVLAQTKPAVPTKPGTSSSRDARAQPRKAAIEERAPLSPAELEVAQRVHVGNLPCELGQTVALAAEPVAPGFFSLRIGKDSYRVSPVETTTGAIRLEDKTAGVVWLQLANKSMLMSQKLGKRLADECKSPAQMLVAEAMLKQPPPSVLDAPAAPTAAASTPVAGATAPATSMTPAASTVPAVPPMPATPASQ